MNNILEFHPISNAFDLLEGEPFEQFKNDIKTNGLLNPITLYNGQVLDGRNRYRACMSASVEPRFTTYSGNYPASYVASSNAKRRHDCPTALAKAANNLTPYFAEEAKARQLGALKQNTTVSANCSNGENGRAAELAASAVGVSTRYVYEAAKIQKEHPELYAQMGDKKFGKMDIADVKREIKKEEHKQKVEQVQSGRIVVTQNGPFDLVLADPPWKYHEEDADYSRNVDNHYETIDIEAIIEQKPNVKDDSILLLWATATKLPEALQVLEAWGFTYKTHAIWDKETFGMGHWFRIQHELLIVATKGKVECPIPSQRISSILTEKKTEHSKKPECVYKWIEDTFPTLSKLEMYCRTPRTGWAVFGNEV